ncbi:FAD-dependent oxidoreductase [Patiriisocius marinistellae]|uniref:FAD-dependent oxidoreductase n=1 Tax=Patiriisocius marinistellae TaxID=2494560 RepID=A0A5J4FZ48_9FLAO|nr:FAD-dependent oxidoreductase [Patiriisocius marinistellae]GEQ85439.1 FAD-dependent oxidoreductase [Patiriisocius marinistellae]
MEKVDYILVGLGIAGIAFVEQLLKYNKSFIVFDDYNEGATAASGGVLNPTILKRFTAAWNAVEFLDTAIPFYKTIENRLSIKIVNSYPVYRILNNIEEQNNWIVASDKKELSRFLSSEILKNENKFVVAPFGLGEVNDAAKINPIQLINLYRTFLKDNNHHVSEAFRYKELHISEEKVIYNNFEAEKIVFAEGAGVINNPFFPLSISPNRDKVFVPNKGEYVIIKAPQLKLNAILKGGMMLIPLGGHLYKVGASYGRDEIDVHTTQKAQESIVEKLDKMIDCDYEIVNQVAGVRPTVKDRKPLIGTLLQHKNVAFLNGLGTRGLSMAPLLSQYLFNYLEHQTPLPSEVDLKRFKT